LRNIPPCGSCHGSIDHKIGSPWLRGQPAAYIKAQLQAFARGERNNDISQQMRNIARHMTPHEIDEAARYYSSFSQPARSMDAKTRYTPAVSIITQDEPAKEEMARGQFGETAVGNQDRSKSTEVGRVV
jgi:cytochrome c553